MAETIQQQAGEERIDYNALDNTTAGRALQAAFVAAALAVPDYTRSTPARALAWVGIGAAALGTVAAFNAFDEDPRNDLTALIDDAPAAETTGSPAKTWGLVAAGLAAFAAGIRAHVAVQTRVANALRKRGVSLPNTVFGAAFAAVTFVASELGAR